VDQAAGGGMRFRDATAHAVTGTVSEHAQSTHWHTLWWGRA
jgi:hypothetical protein